MVLQIGAQRARSVQGSVNTLAALAQIIQLGVTIHTRHDGDYKIARASASLLPLMRTVTGGIDSNDLTELFPVATKVREILFGSVLDKAQSAKNFVKAGWRRGGLTGKYYDRTTNVTVVINPITENVISFHKGI